MSKHNKSRKWLISLSYGKKELVQEWKAVLEKGLNERPYFAPGLCEESLCSLMTSSKGSTRGRPLASGRLVVNRKQRCYCYQLVAFYKYGRSIMKLVTASKEADHLSISHLCGTSYCCNASHIIVEPKYVNDERVHCHFAMESLLSATGDWGAVRKFLEDGGCPHEPQCGTAENPDLDNELPTDELVFDDEDGLEEEDASE